MVCHRTIADVKDAVLVPVVQTGRLRIQCEKNLFTRYTQALYTF